MGNQSGKPHNLELGELAVEDQARAQMYRLLARFLSAPPDAAVLAAATGLRGDNSALGQALCGFANQCGDADRHAMAMQFDALFIGLGRGELVPYASYYLTGFLHEKPLAKLRQDMKRLGLAKDPAVAEPEDHIASVLEIMAGLIDGQLGAVLAPVDQKAFYDAHIASWAPTFFRDLESVEQSDVYSSIGRIGRLFLEIELTALRFI